MDDEVKLINLIIKWYAMELKAIKNIVVLNQL